MAGMLQRAADFMGLNEPRVADEADDQPFDMGFEETPEDFGSDVALFPKPKVVSSSARDLQRIVTIKPISFEDAPKVGDAFREGVPVIVNVSSMKEAEARRMIDFTAGLVYGLHGKMERVTNRVFLLSPETVAITAAKDESSTHGFFQ